jgi:spermidine/putrescine transport system substrate-binding protein
MQIELKRIQREVGITFIFVTHDQGEALTMSDRIAVMSRGRVEQIGTPEDIYEAPASIFVAGFIGSANLLPGTLDGTAGAPVAVLDSGVRVSLPSSGDARSGDPITVMVRPERITIGANGDGDGHSLPATVKDVIFQGSTLRLIADAAGGTEMLVTVEADDNTPDLRPGDAITLNWSPGAAYLLRGRSEIVGATTTDVDEVQATMDGVDVAEAKAGEAEEDRPRRFSRRAVLIGGGIAAAGAVGAVLLSGVGKSSSSATASPDESGNGVAGGGIGQGASAVRIITWTEYIDVTEDGKVGTVDRFRKETGIDITYSETWNDNNEAYGKEFAAYLESGNPTPWDIAVPTYWMAARLKAKNWLAPLPFNLIPNYENLDPQYINLAWDRGAKYHLPWQAGITGFAYNASVTGRELKSINDLFLPEFKGKIGLFTEMRDTIGLVMLGQGNDPSAPTVETLTQALEQVAKATADGQVRRFTGNDYLQDIQNGNFAACMAWSGDIAQIDNPDVKFVFPEEGAMSWFDTMVIPVQAANGVAAAKWMNFVYDPVNAAQITASVQYVTPVVGVREELIKMGGDAAALADNTLLFPDDAIKAQLHSFGDLPPDLDQEVTDRFVTITGG